ncbi:hypothetical protein BH24ACT19_BH24ACT19_10760 [soil metagenome]|jgi:anti-sigma-K factor RskA
MDKRRNPDGEHERARDLLGPYVLGTLEPEEERLVESHLGGCAACRDEERGLRETHERLAGASIAAASVPADLKARILDALPRRETVRGARRTARSRVSWVGAAAAVLLLFTLAGMYSAGLFERAQTTASLAATELAPGAGGELEIRGSGQEMEADLEVWGLPPTGPDEYYELWLGREDGRVSAGTFAVDDRGRGEISTLCPRLAGEYQRAGITLERFPEEPSMDSARVVLRADLRGS